MRTQSTYTPRPQPKMEFRTGFREDREMLVLSRKAEQSIVINGEITVRIIAVKGNLVRIGIEAPQEVPIRRGELPVRLPEPGRQLCPA